MKLTHVAFTAAAIMSSCLSFNVAAHALWLEGNFGNATATKLYFGEYAENLREPSPGRLDSIIDPAVAVVDAAGRGKPVDAYRENNHFAITGGGTVIVQALKQPVREPQGETPAPAQRRFLYARLGKGGSLPLDIDNNGNLLRLSFMGKPVAKAEIIVIAPNGWEKHLRTDEKGETAFSLPEPGLYIIEATHELSKPGEFEGKAYAVEVHRTTLSLYK
ncbi:hypothetical protein [Nitrosovibrio tenuis]|uniref:DUF4198 domain-containing protein n=1 Tax=Nitrosovibrio tenuis TaxID=1233 RepID=A0A1H7GKM5_9PROT|nr:hypothetical protein [Nitrosovibrio tenuis]SEK36415.1 hypothetical protein SAMN05216387_101252 [Nitrosovibrio tenuis]